MLLSILIPAYQEEKTIAEIIAQVVAVDTESVGFDKEVIVCDDGSRDRTRELALEAAKKDKRVRVVWNEKNRGKGAAIKTALDAATGDYCLIQDADLEYDVADYPALLREVEKGADVVYGSRFLANPRPTGMKLPNFIANRALSITSNLLFGMSITDEATCFKLFRTDLLRSYDLECERFEFCPEVTAKTGNRGIPIVEVPISYSARAIADGKKIRWTDGVEAMWVLIKHRLRKS
ncbi:MAG TPA: glycosyltransferase family 2 protein [Kofleriaceae bacterium]|nr:glycosyltransferase family 2 protein [Kofleriaceae bacterium]